jgi:lipopolysaccharide export system protein LptC
MQLAPASATASVTGATPPRKPWTLRALLQMLSLYLPVLLMALLALGTFWLASNTPEFASGPEPRREPKHEPDYFMRNFSVRNFDALGAPISQLGGRELRHYPDTDTYEVDGAQMRTAREGRVTTGRADRAYSNADGSEVQLVGNAVVVREAGPDAQGRLQPRMEFRGEFLHVYTVTEKLKSHKPVTIVRDNNGRIDRIEAGGLSYDNVERIAEFTGRTRATLSPRPAP